MKGSLGELASSRQNNFDFIRFAAASLVIFSHAYPLSGRNDFEPLLVLTGGIQSLGGIAVAIFFIISGYLITQSYDRSAHLINFLVARMLRILPGLMFVLLLTVFVLGPLITNLSLSDYFANPGTFDYLKNIMLHPIRFYLPGVYEHNVYQGAVNGSLWTLEFEAFCYLIVACLGMLRLLKKPFILLFFLFVLAVPHLPFIINQYYYTSLISLELVKYFAAGMMLYAFRNHIPHNKYLAWFSGLMLLVGLIDTAHFKLFVAIFGAYLVMYLAFKPTKSLYQFSKHGDLSYGIYIYAFPIQQLVAMWFGTSITPAKSFVFSYPLTLICAYISWHLIEKHALKLKKFKFPGLVTKQANQTAKDL